ncbi:type IV pili methyl-accepting chemotaxis transducer N-terminal domain-containing protein [Rubritalea spongiae]|uniref:Type IV pili methyl-accepting chemotaxis transducer N-terminal domain-containing protein n=1 Tax=Rubritalea spongiae TaxID=430797 RepID=A0ABW5DXU6_9BACT
MKKVALQETMKKGRGFLDLQSYRGIQFSGVLFVVLMTGMLVANMVISNSLKDDSAGINLAGRQRMLSQQMTKSVAAVQSSLMAGDIEDAKGFQEELSLSSGLFNDTLLAFRNGGSTTGADGGLVYLEKIEDVHLLGAVEEASRLWDEVSGAVFKVANNDLGTLDVEAVEAARNQMSETNLSLLELMNQLTVGLENKAESKSDILQWVMAGALLLVVGNFAYVILYSVGLLKKRDRKLKLFSDDLVAKNAELVGTNEELEAAKEEIFETNKMLEGTLESLRRSSDEAQQRASEQEKLTVDLNRLKEESDTIFNTVDHGLCLIDPEFKIGRRISAATYSIFETKRLSGISFLELMQPLISERDLMTLERFLKLHFQTKTSTRQLKKYNPLKKIEITLKWDEDGFVSKHLSFEFERIFEGNSIIAVLITITDVTETTALENELKRASADQERKTDLLLEVVQCDSKEFEQYLSETEHVVEEINGLLRSRDADFEGDGVPVAELVEKAFKLVYKIRGGAVLLGLESIVEVALEMEATLTHLRNRSEVRGDEFLGALVQLTALRDRLSDYRELTQSVLKEHATGRALEASKSASVGLAEELSRFAGKLASDLGKEVYVRSRLEMDAMSSKAFRALKDVMIQVVCNSLVHGIEPPRERSERGKLAEGSIVLHCIKSESVENVLGCPCYALTFRDDGAGMDIEAIKDKALSHGIIGVHEAEKMTKAEIASLVFKPNFSMQWGASEYAGHGAGMGIVRDVVISQFGGKVSISYVAGKYLQIHCLIPAANLENVDGSGMDDYYAAEACAHALSGENEGGSGHGS